MIKGWGGPGLLDGYEAGASADRHPQRCGRGLGRRGRADRRALVTPAADDDTPEGEAKRRELAASFEVNHRRMHGMVGVEAAYSYAGSPLIVDEPATSRNGKPAATRRTRAPASAFPTCG